VIASVGAVRSGVLPACTVHPNERDVVSRPSVTNTVTVYVPAVVGVPVMIPVLEFKLTPKGSPL
jgi:hypothetical protein